ncbi:hypothetical protein ABZ354_08540 [Streptomyces sp. NPDC005925]|uniref:hypothetical protein n=1 Tax=Streptomyces sp. NPDC005925 TaxID=3157172 RepID=UPI0033FC7CB8
MGSQTSLLMAVGRPVYGPTEGERASDGLRCAYAGMPVSSSGTPVSAVAQTSRTHLDPHPEEQLA